MEENVKTLELSPDMEKSVTDVVNEAIANGETPNMEEALQDATAKVEETRPETEPNTMNERIALIEKDVKVLHTEASRLTNAVSSLFASLAQVGLNHGYISMNPPAPP